MSSKCVVAVALLMLMARAAVSDDKPLRDLPAGRPPAPTSDVVCLSLASVQAGFKVTASSSEPASYQPVCTFEVDDKNNKFNDCAKKAKAFVSAAKCGTAVLYIATEISQPGDGKNQFQLFSSNTQIWIDESGSIAAPNTLSGWLDSDKNLPRALLSIGDYGAKKWIVRVGLCGNGNGYSTGGKVRGRSDGNLWYTGISKDECGDKWKPTDDNWKGTGISKSQQKNWQNDGTNKAPKLVEVSYVNYFSANGVQLLNSPHFTLYMQKVQRVYISRLNIAVPAIGADVESGCNLDGIDMTYAYGVTVEDSSIQSGDDNIAVKWMCAGVRVQRVNAYNGHGFTVGQQSGGDINKGEAPICNTDVKFTSVTGVTMRQTISLKALPTRSYDLSGVYYEDVCTVQPQMPIWARTWDGEKDAKDEADGYKGDLATISAQITGLTVKGKDGTCPDRVRREGAWQNQQFTLSIENSQTKEKAKKSDDWQQQSKIACKDESDKSADKKKEITCVIVFAGAISWNTKDNKELKCTRNDVHNPLEAGDSLFCSSQNPATTTDNGDWKWFTKGCLPSFNWDTPCTNGFKTQPRGPTLWDEPQGEVKPPEQFVPRVRTEL